MKLDHLDMSISVHVEPVKGPRHRPMFEELAQTYESDVIGFISELSLAWLIYDLVCVIVSGNF